MNRTIPLAVRAVFAVVATGVIGYLSQVVVFFYTRSMSAPIPAGEIVGLHPFAAGAVVSSIWLAASAVSLLLFAAFEPVSGAGEVEKNNTMARFCRDVGQAVRN